MHTRPPDVADETVLEAVRSGWRVPADIAEYRPVGYGSHHWKIGAAGELRWFATLDDLVARRRSSHDTLDFTFAALDAALTTATAAKRAGLDFVVAPLLAPDGDVLLRLGETYALSLYPHVDGRTYGFGDVLPAQHRLQLLEMLAALHDLDEDVRRSACHDELAVQCRDGLASALEQLSVPWDGGPYGERCRTLLHGHVSAVADRLQRFDALSAEARSRTERMVLTHGEPHPGNLIRTGDGLVIVDWDTVRVAPPERDLWLLEPGDGSVAAAYTARTGRAVLPEMMELYRLAWTLTDVAMFVTQLSNPHERSADTEVAWNALAGTLASWR